jgi:hypothetical protein
MSGPVSSSSRPTTQLFFLSVSLLLPQMRIFFPIPGENNARGG